MWTCIQRWRLIAVWGQGDAVPSTSGVQDDAEYERTVQRLDKILAERQER